jgi:hypothetical protein
LAGAENCKRRKLRFRLLKSCSSFQPSAILDEVRLLGSPFGNAKCHEQDRLMSPPRAPRAESQAIVFTAKRLVFIDEPSVDDQNGSPFRSLSARRAEAASSHRRCRRNRSLSARLSPDLNPS